jgi:hypothetical protein
MHIEKILALIATRPKIRTVEIADLVDMEPDQVEPTLRRYIAGGQILMTEVIAPNGRPVAGFEFSDLFKNSETYRSAMAGLAIKKEQHATEHVITPLGAPPTGAEPVYREPTATGTIIRRDLPEHGPVAKRTPFSKPEPQTTYPKTATPAKAPRLGKPELVLEYLRNQPGQRATTEEIRIVMELAPDAHVNAYLSRALRATKLYREGDIWSLNAFSAPAPSPATKEQATPALEGAQIVSDSLEVHAPSSPGQAMSIRSIKKKPLRVAHWSNGELELKRGSQPVALLTKAEVKLLQKYLSLGVAAQL